MGNAPQFTTKKKKFGARVAYALSVMAFLLSFLMLKSTGVNTLCPNNFDCFLCLLKQTRYPS